MLSHSDNHPRVACDNQPHDNIASVKIVIFRLRHLCDGLLYRIALIADFMLNSMHRTIHTNLKQNDHYIISNNNYKYYKSHAKSDMYLQSRIILSAAKVCILCGSVCYAHVTCKPPQGTAIQRIRYWQCDNQPV